MIDYAMPTMKAERHLKNLHNMALEKRWLKARFEAECAILAATAAYAALLIMEERDAEETLKRQLQEAARLNGAA